MLIIHEKKCPNGGDGEGVNGGGTEGIALFYGSHLSSVIINTLFQEGETEATGPSWANKLRLDWPISIIITTVVP